MLLYFYFFSGRRASGAARSSAWRAAPAAGQLAAAKGVHNSPELRQAMEEYDHDRFEWSADLREQLGGLASETGSVSGTGGEGSEGSGEEGWESGEERGRKDAQDARKMRQRDASRDAT